MAYSGTNLNLVFKSVSQCEPSSYPNNWKLEGVEMLYLDQIKIKLYYTYSVIFYAGNKVL